MTLSRQVVDLIRLGFLDDPDEIGAVGQIAVMHEEVDVFLMWIFVEMIHSRSIE